MVYSAYWRAARALPDPGDPVAPPAEIPNFSLPRGAPRRVTLDELRAAAARARLGGRPAGELDARRSRRAKTPRRFPCGRGLQITPRGAIIPRGPTSRASRRISALAKSRPGRSSPPSERPCGRPKLKHRRGSRQIPERNALARVQLSRPFQPPGRCYGQSSAPFRSDALARSARARTRRMADMGARATRWSTPACANSGRPATCTIACAWSRPPFSSSIS